MIIKGLAELVYGLLDLFLVFQLPALPSSVVTVANAGVDVICSGIGIISAFIGPTAMALVAVLLTLLLAMHTAYMVYNFVCFILRKIPMLNVEM